MFNIGDNLDEAQTLSYQCSMVERAVMVSTIARCIIVDKSCAKDGQNVFELIPNYQIAARRPNAK